MTPQQIQDRNKDIALMLGAYTKSMMGANAWVLNEDELNLSFDIFDEKIFSNNGGSGWKIKDLKFNSDWNWLMESIRFIEDLNNKSPNGIFVKINTGGCFIHPINDTSNYIAQVYQAGKTKKETVFIAISDFANLYNNNKL